MARDTGFSTRLPLRGGGSTSALEVQWAYCRTARRYAAQREGEPWEVVALRWWELLLDALENGRPGPEVCLDWAIKRTLFDDGLLQLGVDWDELAAWQPVLTATWEHPLPARPPVEGWQAWVGRRLRHPRDLDERMRGAWLDWRRYPVVRRAVATLRVLDIRYHDVDPASDLCSQLGDVARLVDDGEIERARQHPPADTRAAVRGYAIKQAVRRREELRMDWDRLLFPGTGEEVPLPDPLAADLAVLDRHFGVVPPLFVSGGAARKARQAAPRQQASQPPPDPALASQGADEEPIEIVVLDIENLPEN